MTRSDRTPSPAPLQIVWFKRDLRLADHAPLCAAAGAGPVLPLYIAEPDYWALPDTSYRQWAFLRGAVEDLGERIAEAGGALHIAIGDTVEVLRALREKHGQFVLHAHEETGNHWTYRRDEAVRAWAKEAGVPFREHRQYGILRGSQLDRDRWSRSWDAFMAEPVRDVPQVEWAPAAPSPVPTPEALGLDHDGIDWLQPAGRAAALDTLNAFLTDRGETYRTAMSSPISGWDACSRLSVHFVAGSISMREAYQATVRRQEEVAGLPKSERGTWPGALQSFIGRLHWHCHFMQKLEAEPELEWRPMARAYEGLRPEPNHPERLERFAEGRTGYPFVDACMRSLHAVGWINFRMRAMLMSFASYDLWLPWQRSGAVLARLFTDYEPGIHWTQAQMQSGETGINAVRIYSPIKQSYDQDPDGAFIRRWVPELAHLSGKDLHEPWRLDALPDGYPERIVDHASAAREAKRRIG
ncbi:MAG: FAD-binding domain-containing protein [Pseudomonadota bacterium]